MTKSKGVKLAMEIKYFQTCQPGNKNSYWRLCKLGIKNWKWWSVTECRRAASQHNKVQLLKVTWHACSTTSIFLLQLKHFVQYKILHNRLQVHAVMNIMTTACQQVTTYSLVDRWQITFHKNLHWLSEPSPKKEWNLIPSLATQTSTHQFQYQAP